MKFTLFVPHPTPSLNEFFHAHWRKQHSAKKVWSTHLLFAVQNSGNLDRYRAHGKRRVTVERFGKRKLDVDNFVGGLKSVVIDNLRGLGLLLDDTAEEMELVTLQGELPSKTQPHTEITLEDV